MIFEDYTSSRKDEDHELPQLPSNARARRRGNIVDVVVVCILIIALIICYQTMLDNYLIVFIILFPSVWTPLRMLPTLKFLSNRRLREDLALTPVDATSYLSSHIKPVLYRFILLYTILIVGIFILGIKIGLDFNNVGFIFLIIPALSILIVFEVLIGLIIISIIFHKTIWKQLPELSGLAITTIIALPLIISILTLYVEILALEPTEGGSIVLSVLFHISMPIILFSWIKSRWEAIFADYLKME